MSKWSIEITDFLGGFAPETNDSANSGYGNKNQSSDMVGIDLSDPNHLVPGPKLAAMTNGTQAGAVTTLIKSILDNAVSADTTYGTGGDKLYKLAADSVTNAGIWPHTINKGAVTGEDGEDVVNYKGAIYYLYNHSGSAGDIGKYDLNVTFDDDWGSTVPSGAAALTSNPHPVANGGNDTFAFGNGRYVGTYDGTTLQTQALDLPEGFVVVAIQWLNEKWWISANRPNLTGANQNTSSIFIWDGTTDSWEVEIPTKGTCGGSYVKNGVFFQFYQPVRNENEDAFVKLGYINGGIMADVFDYPGSLPSYYQITEFRNFIAWNADGSHYMWGTGAPALPTRIFRIWGEGNQGTTGAYAAPFGTPMAASNITTSYTLATYDITLFTTVASWTSLTFDITGPGRESKIDSVRVNFEPLSTGAAVYFKLYSLTSEALETPIFEETISTAKLGANVTSVYYPFNGKATENFFFKFDYSAMSAASENAVRIRSVKIYGSRD